MGRTVLLDRRVEETISTLWPGTQKTSIGLIIGQQTAQRDYIVHIAQTPCSDEADSCSGSDAEGDAVRIPRKAEINKATLNLTSTDDRWVASHAKQALRMLPGGLNIIGIFAMAPPDDMNKAQMKLKQVLYTVEKTVSKMPYRSAEGVTDRILLQLCPNSRKMTCRTFDCADAKSGARPAELKTQSLLEKWHRLDTRLAVNLEFPIPKDISSQNIYKQIQNGLTPLCDNVHNALAIVNNKLMSNDSPLIAPPSQSERSSKKGKKQKDSKTEGSDASQMFSVQLLAQLSNDGSYGDPYSTDCKAKMFVRGAICGRAFVHNKATVGEGIQVLKEDLVRSLLSRCQLLCDDLLQAEEEQDPKVLYEAPVRVFGNIKETPVSFCDYIFQDEQNSDSADRFQELMDLYIDEESIETDCEHIPTEEELQLPMKELGASQESLDSVSKERCSFQYLGLGIAGVVAAIAAGISFVYLDH